LPWLAYLLPIKDTTWLAIAVGVGGVLSAFGIIWLFKINKKEQEKTEEIVKKRELVSEAV
jgi:hypothetical protein